MPSRGLVNLAKILAAGGIIAILIFYLIPFFGIAPKTILVIDIIMASLLIWAWRKLFTELLIKATKIKIFFWDNLKEKNDLTDYLKQRSQLGYETTKEVSSADVIVISEGAKQNPELVQVFYKMVLAGKTIIDFNKFYESITGKIPVSLIDEAWFLENLMEINKQALERFKRGLDIVFSLILFIPYIFITPFVALSIKLSSKGPIFYRQKRVGKEGKILGIIKFRSMIVNAEKNGAQWAKERDERVTFIGKILRKTRIDELPQIWNVLKGDLSFVGPRPERPEFVEELKKQIPHYSMRHLIKPGLSGWAQINFPYGASVEDAMEKLQYDLFYLKNRSLGLDIAILLKTIMIIIRKEGR
jgi:exopolysaccharide biosynthesis polyprenyl glycosylphosphotransferase